MHIINQSAKKVKAQTIKKMSQNQSNKASETTIQNRTSVSVINKLQYNSPR